MTIKGKVVYWVDGKRFENSEGKRDGREKAMAYCLDNFLNSMGIQKFDSRTECSRYEYLLEQERAGRISGLSHHFTLKVLDGYVNAGGEEIPPLTYEADFIYKDADGRAIVEDVKGSEYFIDERFLTIKQVFDRAFLKRGLWIKVVLLRGGQWVEWRMGDKKKSGKLIAKQRAELKALKQANHEREVLERRKERDLKRLDELRSLPKLTSTERKRLAELVEKYEKTAK